MKRCPKCGEEKSLEEFYNNKSRPPEYKDSYCIECKRVIDKSNRTKYPERHLLMHAKCRAKKFGIPFDLELDDIVIPELCPIFNKPIIFGAGRQHPFSPSVDRIIPSKGYIKNNIVVISLRANRLKSDASIEELKMISDFYNK